MCPGPNQSTCLILMCLRRWLPPRALARPYNSPVGSPRPISSSQCKVIARTDVVSSSSSLSCTNVALIVTRVATDPLTRRLISLFRPIETIAANGVLSKMDELRQNKIAAQRFKIFQLRYTCQVSESLISPFFKRGLVIDLRSPVSESDLSLL